jgi:hypothetical protein
MPWKGTMTMTNMRRILLAAVGSALLAGWLGAGVPAAEEEFTIGEGKLTFTIPPGWTRKAPASRIVEAELAVPPAPGDTTPGRMTAMGAGGSIEENIRRWVGQFVGPGGKEVQPKLDKLSVSGCEVQIVDLSGTYKDSPGGPFAGGQTILRDNYRMLGAIIQTKEAGNYFLKLYGPKATIDQHAQAFHELVKSLKVK